MPVHEGSFQLFLPPRILANLNHRTNSMAQRNNAKYRHGISVLGVAVFLVLIAAGVGFGVYKFMPERSDNGPTVSYTHLTLPTIYSV